MSVATEMVAELDITDQDVNQIADMIDGEIASLVPDWRLGTGIFANMSFCQNCASNHTSCGSLMDYLSKNPGANNLQFLQCSSHGCAAMHGRFEEITYQVNDGSEHHVTEGAPMVSSHSENSHYNEIWDYHGSAELSSLGSSGSHSDEEHEKLDESVSAEDDTKIGLKNEISIKDDCSLSEIHSLQCAISDDYENEIQQELRWVKAKYQMELAKLRDQQLGIEPKSSKYKTDNGVLLCQVSNTAQGNNKGNEQHCSVNWHSRVNNSCLKVGHCEANKESHNAENMDTAKSFYSGSLVPFSLHRTTSLPVDAIDL